jgi:hypothetical protein
MKTTYARRLLCLFWLLLAGCGYTHGLLRDSITQVRIDRAGFQIIRPGVRASATVPYVFCTMPLSDAPYADLMADLDQKAHLGPDQIMINFREDKEVQWYLVLCLATYTVSADVIEFEASK